ncbi:PREDICTED: leucine-rich repeat-containing protein 37A2-like [Miniopterus natalensis]|uniref:leucine-rich repeat-containing protein 37A2-like n=1 Tax=Miniopterus natalensis TaxID=291302 RepID=UPI0007A6E5A1|nr:PREDICTED: leucine-rich repeat-containing protein 37A2-like [Miniopterus natalensis]
MKLLTDQEIKVSKSEWDTEQWKNERAGFQGEQEEEPKEARKVPGYNKKLLMATPVIGVTTFFIIIFCLIVICHRKEATERSSSGFFPSLRSKSCSSEQEMEEGGFWRRRPLWLKDMYRPLGSTKTKRKVEQKPRHNENELFMKM